MEGLKYINLTIEEIGAILQGTQVHVEADSDCKKSLLFKLRNSKKGRMLL